MIVCAAFFSLDHKNRRFCVFTLLSGVVYEVFRHLQVLRSSIRVRSSTGAATTSSLCGHMQAVKTFNLLREMQDCLL